jgi:hypothetical protein
MTTIAFRYPFVACDSRVRTRDSVTDDQFSKHVVREDPETKELIHFWVAGMKFHTEILIDAFIKNDHSSWNNDHFKTLQASAIVWDGEQMYSCSFSNTVGFWKEKERIDNIIALGSGEDYAVGAMEMGASALQAVQCAARRCVSTGGYIRVYDLQTDTEKVYEPKIDYQEVSTDRIEVHFSIQD